MVGESLSIPAEGSRGGDPVTEYKETGNSIRRRKGEFKRTVEVSEDEISDVRIALNSSLGKINVRSQVLGLAGMGGAAAIRPAMGKSHRPAGMDSGIKALAQRGAEKGTKKAEGGIRVSFITVGKEESGPEEIDDKRRTVNDGAELFGKIVEKPDVMVTGKEMELNAVIGEFGKLAKKTSITLRDNMAILEPIIEGVSKEPDRLGVKVYTFEPTYHTAFHSRGIRMASAAEMRIGREVNTHQRKPNSNLASSDIISLFHSGSKTRRTLT
jgi:hypothetical protein